MNPIDNSAMELLGRIQKLERRLESISTNQEEQGATVQQLEEEVSGRIEYGHQNLIRNGDLEWDRNAYIYTTDFAGGTGEDGNVSLEAAHVFAHPIDTAVETTGSITSGLTALTIDDALFVAGDNGVEIVVYGAGAAGADLVTTINGAPGTTTTCTLTDAAGTTVSGARVRFRLLELTEDSTDENADANLATNTCLKTSTHTRYASTVNNPDYDKTNGWLRWSDAANMLTCPLPFNAVYPSKQYIVTFIYKLNNPVDGEDEVFVDFFAGIWDNSAGKRQFLEGTQPSLSGTMVGTTGATSRDYMVLMYLSNGTTVATSTVTVADTNATLDSTNYVSLSWEQEPGVVRSEIYRLTGATYELIGLPYPANTFYDTGQTLVTVGSFPASTRDNFRAYAKVTEESTFRLASANEWRLGRMNVVVPSTWNKGGVTDKLWFVLGFDTTITGTDSTRALLVDLISLDDKFGIFTRCPLDFLAQRQITTSPPSGSQGTSGGGGGDVPPGGGGEEPECPVLSDLIDTDHGEIQAAELIDNEHKYLIKNRLGKYVGYKAKVNQPQHVWTLLAGEYKITGSKQHPVFTSEQDVVGKPLYRFQQGDIIQTVAGLQTVDALIKHFKKRHTVKISLEGEEKGYWHNRVAVHNLKEHELP
jgi:hypothetical protein